MSQKPPEPSQADRVITSMGGVRHLSRLTEQFGFRIPATTISGWRNTGFVPAQYQPFLLAIAFRTGLDVMPETFLPLPVKNGKKRSPTDYLPEDMRPSRAA